MTAQRERTNSRNRVSAEVKPRKEVRFQDNVAEVDVEEPKRENVKVSVNVAGSFQLRKSQTVTGELMGVCDQGVQPTVTTSLSKSQKMAERGLMSEELELPKVVEDSSDGQKSGSSKQSNRKPHAENRKDPKIPDGEIMAAINAELWEQHPEDYSRKTDCRC